METADKIMRYVIELRHLGPSSVITLLCYFTSGHFHNSSASLQYVRSEMISGIRQVTLPRKVTASQRNRRSMI